MKQYQIELRSRPDNSPGTRYAVARKLTAEVADRLSARAVLEAAATAMGLNIDPGSFTRTRSSHYAQADVAGAGGRAYISINRDMAGGAS